PHNPVGRVFSREELERISELCLKNIVKLFADEIHCDFIYKGNKFTSLLALEDKYVENTVVATSISKTFNAAGFQASNIIIKDKHMRFAFRKQNGANGYSQANLIGLEATKAAYTYGEEWLDELLEYLEGNLDFLRTYIKENIPKVKLTEPEGTYLLWLDFSEIVEDKKQLKELIINKARLWLDAGSIFGGGSDLFERINIACPRQTLKEALNRLKTAVEEFTNEI
ncbi:MAG: aminotransferase class I/II-fold pyridoxal phosphate-dependent enzyme, partial [Lachnospiraceae bacterium]|nr:aminotransferase class I/II-fold pyridoxal phosphate-dependent enzyme [Lachnospiraceae bacterium]